VAVTFEWTAGQVLSTTPLSELVSAAADGLTSMSSNDIEGPNTSALATHRPLLGTQLCVECPSFPQAVEKVEKEDCNSGL
jgi:hypothetical protein